MVSVAARTVRGQKYYYLTHSYRKGGRVLKRVRYLGRTLPKNLEAIERKFLAEIYEEKWFSLFDRIKLAYAANKRATPKSALEKQREAFAIRFTYDTNRIEGSTLTLRETADLLEHGITPSNKPLRDVKEAESHQRVFFEMLSYRKDLSLRTILYWHKELFGSTKPDIAGKVRRHQVAIARSKFTPPAPFEIQALLDDFFNWYSKSKHALNPVGLAALVHLRFVTIHPFADGNGRIGRLLMNFVLNKQGFPMLDIPYEQRNSYYHALERAQVKQEEAIFLNWFFRKYVKANNRYMHSR